MNSPSKKRYVAIDLGTTTLTGRLMDASGALLAEERIANPQQELGADIIVRLQKADGGDGKKLKSLLADGLRALLEKLFAKSGCVAADVASMAVAGNPGISSLLQGLPVSSLLLPPHRAPQKELVHLSADEFVPDLRSSLELFPMVSAFVGGDLVACLFALSDVNPGTLLIDVGTNAELALWDGTRWWVTSAAAGPAFEGGNISSGMIVTDGAVTDVQLVDDLLQLTVAGGGRPRGLCGSGLAALAAAIRSGGLIDVTGRILSPDEVDTNLVRYLVEHENGWAIRYHRDANVTLLLTQDDLRHFQLAKGAVRAGTQVLLERAGFAAEDMSGVLITGALGTALPVEVLKRVALLPEPMLDKTSFVANGVLAGLQAYLTATDGQQRLTELVNTIQPFPLSGTPAFERFFLAALEF